MPKRSGGRFSPGESVSKISGPSVFSSGALGVLRTLCGVHLARLRLRDFRNYARLDAEFSPGFQLLLGDNAQGKTNLLEALYVMATLRSFRGVGGSQMIRHGEKGYFIGGTIEGQGTNDVKIYWSQKERKISPLSASLWKSPAKLSSR